VDLCLMIEGQEGVSWEDWLALARACEAHGVPALFRSDHYLNLDGEHPERGSLDAWATISALAAVTTTLRLGTLVSPATFRHPSELAKVVATADHVSGGRVELGLGAGWHDGEHRAYGFPFPPVRERMDMLAEQLEIVHGSWTEPRFSFSGEHYALQGLDAQPRPLQQPHPPLLMGGRAGPRSAALAARWADEYNTPFASPEDVRARKGAIDAACEEAGREPIPFSLMTGFLVGLDRADLRERAAALAHATGEPERDVDAWLASPPEEWIVGTVDDVAERLAELRGAGLSRVMLQHLLHTDLETVELIGRKLAPAVA
jgi:F420-dependent oxidoreductase-like protein